MTREPRAYVKLPDDHKLKNRLTVMPRTHRAILVLMGIGIAYSFVASSEANLRRASESTGRFPEKFRDQHAVAVQPQSVASNLDALQRLPESLRVSLQATKTRSSKDVCRIAERLVREPTVARIDTIAHYLSKDVHRWSDRMIALYLNADPSLAKAADKGEMKERLLHKWETDRGIVQRWLQGCGVLVRAAIGRGRPIIEREAPEILADIISVIATGVRKNEPDAIAAAEALARAGESIRDSLK